MYESEDGKALKPTKLPTSKRNELEELKAADKIEALEGKFVRRPSDEWMTAQEWWKNASDKDRRDMVYGMAYFNAAKPKLIARYFHIKEEEVKVYKDVWDMGDAARIMHINGHQLRWAFTTNQPNAKFFMGLQFAGQVQNPVHEGVESIDENKESSINITVIGKDQVGGTATIHDGLSGEEHTVQ